MFKDTLRAKNVVFLTDSHSKVWYLSFILTKTSYLLIKLIGKPSLIIIMFISEMSMQGPQLLFISSKYANFMFKDTLRT